MKLISADMTKPSATTSPKWTYRIIRDAAELESLREPWLSLMQRSAMNEVMLTPMWLFTWWEIYGERSGRELRVGLFYDGDRLVGIAPFCVRRCWHRPGIPFHRLEPLGSDLDEPDSVCSDYLNVICEAGSEQRMAAELVRQLQDDAFGRWDELVIPGMDGDGPMPGELQFAFAEAGLIAHCEETVGAPYITLPSSWDDYLQSLSKRNRYLVRRTLRNFNEWGGDKIAFHRVTTNSDIEQGMEILKALHRERWQEAGQHGVFASSRFTTFHEQLMPQLHDANALELIWITLDGKPIAADYSLIWNGKQYTYQGGRKMDVPQGLRPGVLIVAYGIQSAIERGLREYDFLAGEVLYKKQLALATRPIVTFRAVRAVWKERLRKLGECGVACGRAVRGGIRRVKSLFRKKDESV